MDKDSPHPPYDQQENEPQLWYERFVQYYLLLGPGRTLRKAWLMHLLDAKPDRYEKASKTRVSADVNWSEKCTEWSWRDRADAYDSEMSQQAMKSVESARTLILEHADKAAEALILALAQPRQRVAAAKEILDRAGIPAVKEVRVGSTPYTQEELQHAAKDIGEWEKDFETPDENG